MVYDQPSWIEPDQNNNNAIFHSLLAYVVLLWGMETSADRILQRSSIISLCDLGYKESRNSCFRKEEYLSCHRCLTWSVLWASILVNLELCPGFACLSLDNFARHSLDSLCNDSLIGFVICDLVILVLFKKKHTFCFNINLLVHILEYIFLINLGRNIFKPFISYVTWHYKIKFVLYQLAWYKACLSNWALLKAAHNSNNMPRNPSK